MCHGVSKTLPIPQKPTLLKEVKHQLLNMVSLIKNLQVTKINSIVQDPAKKHRDLIQGKKDRENARQNKS